MIFNEESAIKLKQGDQTVLESLVRQYHGPIHAYLLRMGAEFHIANDLTQEVFIKVCRNIQSYNTKLAFKPWIYTIASNTYKDYLKKTHLKKDILQSNFDSNLKIISDNPETEFLKNSERAKVISALMCLKPIYRETLILRYYQDLKLEEIAAVLKIPVGTVKSRLSSSFNHLKKILEKEECSSENHFKREKVSNSFRT